jgi:hypothetical protein
LWRASREQMTRILPLRLMIWQNSHLRFTDALTFIFVLLQLTCKSVKSLLLSAAFVLSFLDVSQIADTQKGA